MSIGRDDRYEDIIGKICEVESLAEMQGLAASICRSYQLANIAYHALYIPGAKIFNPILVLTYDPNWIKRYKEKDYFKIDPVVISGANGFLPLDWSELDRDNGVAEKFFAEAERYDVGRQGITLPIRGACGERALFTITANMSAQEWEARRVSYMKEFQLIAHYMHNRIVELSGHREGVPKPTLSGREMTCISSVARGATVKQIAADQQISDRAVRLYLTSACAKLACSNVHQAIAKMVTLEMLRP